MSQIARAFLYKNGNIVGDTMVNAGDQVTADKILDCCFSAFRACQTQENNETMGKMDERIANILPDWKAFDRIYLFEHLVPRQVMNDLFMNTVEKTDAVSLVESKCHLPRGQEDFTADLEKFKKSLKVKYKDIK